MQGIVVGVLRGGPHSEHEQSVRSGQAALTSLPTDKYLVRDIYIDRNGVWHDRGRVTSPERVLPAIDIALVLVTGAYGATGEIQRLLERYGVPYSGSRPLPSFTASHGVLSREHAKELGLRVPRYRHADNHDRVHDEVAEAARSYHPPLIVRHSASHSPHAAQVLAGYEPVKQAVTGLLAGDCGGVLIEEHVRGPRVSVGVLEQLRNQDRYVLPPRLDRDPHTPSPGQTFGVGSLTKAQQAELEDIAKRLHDLLGLRHHSESTFVLSPRGIVYLGTDPFPHLGSGSDFGKALAGVGIGATELFSHILDLARHDRKR